MKPCIRCAVEKPLDDFYAHPTAADGHFGACKECCKRAAAARRMTKRAEVRAYDRTRSKTPKRRAHAAANTAAWRARRPEVVRAHSAVARAKRSGRLVVPAACSDCGAPHGRLHAHHADYSRPLDVTWLCPACHAKHMP